jgi:hypothetical protein
LDLFLFLFPPFCIIGSGARSFLEFNHFMPIRINHNIDVFRICLEGVCFYWCDHGCDSSLTVYLGTILMRVIPMDARPGNRTPCDNPTYYQLTVANLFYVQEEALKALEERDYKSFQNCIRKGHLWLTAYFSLFAISFITQDSVEPILVLYVLYCSLLLFYYRKTYALICN